MKPLKLTPTAFLCAAALAVLLSGCTAASDPPAPSSPAGAGGSYHTGRIYRGSLSDTKKYTQADYDFALSLRTDGYEQMSVADFNRKVMDWEDEDAYHKAEQSIQRLCWTLPDDDPNADFILNVLGHTWDECSTRHYNACARSQAPGHSSSACYERYGDIFGDKVLLARGCADYWFDYTLTAPDKLTVAQREAIFQKIDSDMGAFLGTKSEKELAGEDAMTKALLSQLKKVLSGLDNQQITTAESDLSYWWEEPYDGYYDDGDPLFEDTNSTAQGSGEQEREDRYTKAQYDTLLKALQFQGWEQMSASEFNRRINAVFNDEKVEDWKTSINYLYDLVLSNLPETDPNAAFLRETVPASLEEYHAKAVEVSLGKTRDPVYRGSASGCQEEDVFGDKVPTAFAQAEYRFTYRLTDPDQLTVSQRDAFLSGVTEAARQSLKGAALTEQTFKAALEQAGKSAGSNKIQFTGCKIDYYDAWRES